MLALVLFATVWMQMMAFAVFVASCRLFFYTETGKRYGFTAAMASFTTVHA